MLAVCLMGCRACMSPPLHDVPQDAQPSKVASDLRLSLDEISRSADGFRYRSDMTLSLTIDGGNRTNSETIEIKARGPRLFFKKQIDDFHRFEAFRDEKDLMVKNHGSEWHRVKDQSGMYQKLFGDGLNLTSWIIHQFALDETLLSAHRQGDGYLLKDVPIDGSCPFFKELLSGSTGFSSIESAKLSGTIALDKATGMPLASHFEMAMSDGHNHLNIETDMGLKLSLGDMELSTPETRGDERISVPTNVARDFLDLIRQEMERGPR